jgi:hypothetical protein
VKVRVHRNLRTGGWSVLRYVRSRGWLLWKHADFVELADATWRVSEAGQARARREARRNVHAFTEGTLERLGATGDSSADRRVRYHFQQTNRFELPDGSTLVESELAAFLPDGSAWA